MSFAFEVLNASPKDSLRMRMRLFRDGQPVWESAEVALEVRAKSVAGKVLARAELPVPAGTPAGEYQLQVEVSDTSKTGKQPAVAAQWVRVEVR